MVYKLGYKLLRDASQQAIKAKLLAFIEEKEP
jgi:hypothetical protein